LIRFAVYVTLIVVCATSANARTIPETLAGAPEATLSVKRPFYEVERCIVLSDILAPAYRTPDRPFNTLFVNRGGVGTQRTIWELAQARDGLVTLKMFEGAGSRARIRHCFE
jgi:hypothetical protein